jgi:uncharacterized protein YbjT (DUF2867 family)
MYVVMGANGHVGSAVADALLREGRQVTVVTRDAWRAAHWQQRGVAVAQADAHDPDALRAAFRRGRRVFLLNPPADVSGDTDVAERATVAGILAALEGVALDKVVAQSTGGARPGERLGDLNVLWELEQGLRSLGVPAAVNRAGFYMSNWDAQLPAVRDTGVLTTLYPEHVALPMAAPRDLGEAAARRLVSGLDDLGVRPVEGPARYTSRDVAQAFAKALGRPVRVSVVPRERWVEAFRGQGFSQAAAESYARMTAAALDSLEPADHAIRGSTTLDEYVQGLVR